MTEFINRRCLLGASFTAVALPAVAQSGSVAVPVPVEMAADGYPVCDRKAECRFLVGSSRQTLAAVIETVDRTGNRVGGTNPNTITTDYSCVTCGKSFVRKS